MGSFWDIFRSQETEEEKLRRKNAALDKKIGSKELEIKMIKKKLEQYKQNKFNRRMRKKKAVIKEVNFDGIERVPESLLIKSVSPLFEVKNFEEIIQKTKDVNQKLKSLGCFKSVRILVDTLPDHHQHYQIKISVEEAHSKPFLNLGVDSAQQDVCGGSLRAGLVNMLGGGERLNVEVSRGCDQYKRRTLQLLTPLHSLSDGLSSEFNIGQETLHNHPTKSILTTTSLGTSLVLSTFNEKLKMRTSLNTRWLDNKYEYKPASLMSAWDPLCQYSGHLLRSVG